MVNEGARNIVFLSRSGLTKPELQETVEVLRKQGAKVAAYACDISNETDLKTAVGQIKDEFPPIKGVIQGAMVLNVRANCSSLPRSNHSSITRMQSSRI